MSRRARLRGWPFFYNNTNREERTHGDRPSLFLRRISKETDRGLLHIGWQVNPYPFLLLVQKLLSELARDPGSGKFKDLHQQKDDQQLQPMQKPFVGGASGWGSWN